ncbi:MAG: hypothetical protein QM784_37265 [Polyangiaceae bacterium]
MSCSSCRKATAAVAAIRRGASGLTQAALGRGQASADVIERRRRECCTCEHLIGPFAASGSGANQLTATNLCRMCGCFVLAKTTLRAEKCPIHRWGTVTG